MTLSQPLSRPFERSIRAFSTNLSRAVSGEVEPLHQTRVATRRLREWLPLCACEVPRALARRARRRLRRVGRALGGVRELDVSIETVTRLIADGHVEAGVGRRLEQYLRDERDTRRERMVRRLTSVNTPKLERDLADVARVLGMRQQTDAWAQLLAVRIERREQRVQKVVRDAGAMYISDRIHAVRIAAKKLRYSLELADETGEARTRKAVREIKVVQEILGRLHDLEVLGVLIQDLTLSGAVTGSFGIQLETLRLELDKDCRQLHSQYVGTRESLLKTCESAAIRAGRIWSERGGDSSSPWLTVSAGRVLKMKLADGRPTKTINRKLSGH